MKCPSIVAAAALLLLSGCASPRPEGTWVSRVGDTDARLAVSIQDTHAVAFICGGEKTFTTHTRWMYNVVDDEDEVVAFEVDGWRLDFAIDSPGAEGELTTSAGDIIAVGATLTSETDIQGIYSSINDGCRDGLIVMNGPLGPETRAVWCDDRGNVRPAEPLASLQDASTATVAEGIPMVATSVSKRREFVVTPLVASELAPAAAP